MIGSVVLTQLLRVTDRQTDRETEIQTELRYQYRAVPSCDAR